jgi:hypothetical protein
MHELTRGQQYADICERWLLEDVHAWNVMLDACDAERARLTAKQK